MTGNWVHWKVNEKNLKISWVKESVLLQLGAISEAVYIEGGGSWKAEQLYVGFYFTCRNFRVVPK